MNRRTVVIIFVGVVLVASAIAVSLIRPRREPPTPLARTETSPSRPVVREAPRAETPAPAPEAVRRSGRRAPTSASKPSLAPAPAEAAPEVGTLHIDSDVPGAQVFIDREYIGATPVTAEKVEAGKHRLNVSAQGYEGVADTIDVTPGSRDIVIKFKEVRLDAAIDVVHKHRLGSCKGRLTATPQGLRYETTDKDDALSGSLMDLDTFQVDYLKKDLRVKLRKGKRYDFTDPDGDADRLFVFQRDVQKAIDRLRKGDEPASR